MHTSNYVIILAAMSVALAASPTPVLADGGFMSPHGVMFHAHLGGGLGRLTVTGTPGFGGKSRMIHAQRHRNAVPFASFPFDGGDGSYTVVESPPPAPEVAPVMPPAPTPVAELPRCRETVDGVSILRGKSCRT
jgi:hypothetical protein